MIGTRSEIELNLARALSRYIGYTTAAYRLDRIVATLRIFEHSSSAYSNELIECVRATMYGTEQNHPMIQPGDRYLREIVNFAESMSIIQTVSQRDARMRRFAPTEQGRALMGARAIGDERFFEHFLTKCILLADADALVAVMDFYASTRTVSLQEHYRRFQRDLRHRRLLWLRSVFKERVLLSRITSNISWVKRSSPTSVPLEQADLSMHTARHHATPRKGWLESLNLLDRNTLCLTPLGDGAYNVLSPDRQYFWLGPAKEAQSKLGVNRQLQMTGPFEDSFRLWPGGHVPRESETQELVDDTARVMMKAYPFTKLVHADQATLRLPMAYIHYRGSADDRAYCATDIMSSVFRNHRSDFVRLSPKRGDIGFYRLNVSRRGKYGGR